MDTITLDLQSTPEWAMLHADDVMLASADQGDLEHQVEAWKDRLARYCLRLNLKKMEYLTVDVIEPTTITVRSTDLSRKDAFKYLGSTIGSDGSFAHEITARIFAAWSK